MKPTLRVKYGSTNLPALTIDGKTVTINYKEGLKTLRTSSVAKTIRNQEDNKVLQAPGPNVNQSEAGYSGYSSTLNSYLHRINPTIHPSPNCPRCNLSPHTTNHLFNCPSNPTELETKILWEDPPPPVAAIFFDLPTDLGVDLDDND